MNPIEWRARKTRVPVLDLEMAYVEVGEGDPIVLLHGNPTSSFLWRNVLPHLEDQGRCIVPDLIGMGDSSPLPGSGPGRYAFATHYRYLDALFETLGVGDRITLVLHDWGSALGFHWACEHRERISGIAHMESLVSPVTWEDWPENARGIFRGFRSPRGEELVLGRNLFVEGVLPNSILRTLTAEEMDEYRRPWAGPEADRWPMLDWPRQIPIDGEPAEMVALVERYSAVLEEWPVPKLFINADPGSILVGRQRELCRQWPTQREVTVPGIHFVQEDSADAIGRALVGFLKELRSVTT